MKADSTAVQAASPVAAADVKYEIFKAMEHAAEADAGNITVEVHEGKVILRGTVASWAEREQAERAARSTPGVTEVRNEILAWH